MSKNIHQQMIDGNGSITLESIERDFNLPDFMTGAKDILQDKEALVEFFNNYKTDDYPDGILLNIFHQAFGQARVNWSADVKRQAWKVVKNDDGKVISKTNIFPELAPDCSTGWIPPMQGISKKSAQTVTESAAMKKLADSYGLSVEQLEILLKSQADKG